MPAYQPFDWYETPLYYDMVFDLETQREADFLREVRARHGTTKGKRVLEPACGSGRLVAAMAKRGFDVTGFDLSEGMLEFARTRLAKHRLQARIVNADMTDFAFKARYDLAHCLVSSFKHVPDEAGARSHLRCVADALKTGGLYVLGLHVTDYETAHCERERWVARRNGVQVVCNIQGWPANRRKREERIRSRLVVTEGRTEKRFETNWTFRTYSRRQLKSLLATEPRLEHVATYDFHHDIDRPATLDEDASDVVIVLRRR